jgi:hypothetical protein
MTDITTAAPTPTIDTKSPLQSTTIQGAFIAIASALAPTLAAKLGVQVQDLVGVVGAIGTIVGFAMTVIGRMRATKKIV